MGQVKLKNLGIQKVRMNGGSLVINLPSHITRNLNLSMDIQFIVQYHSDGLKYEFIRNSNDAMRLFGSQVHKIRRVGSGLGVLVPVNLARQAKLDLNSQVILQIEGNCLLVKSYDTASFSQLVAEDV